MFHIQERYTLRMSALSYECCIHQDPNIIIVCMKTPKKGLYINVFISGIIDKNNMNPHQTVMVFGPLSLHHPSRCDLDEGQYTQTER